MIKQPPYDVTITGGGLAGLSLAVQLKRQNADMRILVLEKQSYPVEEVTHKVGESTVELAAFYFANIVGMKEHLTEYQLPKPGLRFYFTNHDNEDIAQRIEFGHSFWPQHISYQLDRGRFENALAKKCVELGITLIDNARVTEIELGKEAHYVDFHKRTEKTDETVMTRWLVDASGRVGLLKRRLKLQEPVDHHADAVWFRIDEEIDIDKWSDDPAWVARTESNMRRFATNHLLGEGYWVWLIPLASGATSIGIVTDPRFCAHEDVNTLDKAMIWLHENEPQLARELEPKLEKVVDFRRMRDYAYNAKQVFSAERWAVTGEAGVFPDPFYSPGSDYIAFSNTIISILINLEMAGVDIGELTPIYDGFYRGQFEGTLLAYQDQYPVMGDPQAMSAKIIWDGAVYWAISAYLYFRGKLCDLEFLSNLQEEFIAFDAVSRGMQALFIAWARHNPAKAQEPAFIDQFKFTFLYDLLHKDLAVPYEHEELLANMQRNLRLLNALAVAIAEKALPYLPVDEQTAVYQWLPDADPELFNIRAEIEELLIMPLSSLEMAGVMV